MAEPSEYFEELRQLHSSECLSEKRCRCGDWLRRWRVLKDSSNRGRIFLQCQGAWPMDPSGLSQFCLDWSWEDELSPVPEVFSFSEEYILHPDARAYFHSQGFMRRNRLKILDLTGTGGKLLLGRRTCLNLFVCSFPEPRDWSCEGTRPQRDTTQRTNTNRAVSNGGHRKYEYYRRILSPTAKHPQ